MKIGALWAKETREGKKFLAGEIKMPGVDWHISVFKNEERQGNQPDYHITWLPKREQGLQSSDNFKDDSPF